MTATELLAATGNVWQVSCWDTGNRRGLVQTIYVRASDVLRAEAFGKHHSGRRCVDARPWNPAKDRSVIGYIQEVK